MFDFRYIYIHDWNSAGISTAIALAEILDRKVELAAWDERKYFQENAADMLKLIDDDAEVILVGSGMGGFYANYISNNYDICSALFNPCLNPLETLKKFKGKHKTFDGLREYELTDEIINSYNIENKERIVPKVVIIGKNDNVLDPKKTIEHFKGKCQLIETDDTHRIMDYARFKSAILSLECPV